MDHDQAALDIINQWEQGNYHTEKQKKAALQVLIINAMAKLTQGNQDVKAGLIRLAGDMAIGKGFVPCLPEDLPSSTPRSLILSLEIQDARVKDYAAKIGSLARSL